MDQQHRLFMQRCIELAQRGAGKTLSNPLVGCVLVHNNQIISEGCHARFGAAHAERDAIEKIAGDKRLAEATLYVNLEPCAHHGKTPPCANLIAEHKIPRVVYGMADPFAEVDGKGLEYLRQHNVEVIGPVLQEECLWLNRRFVVFNTKKRPYIILKWAQSADGFMAPESRNRVQISGESARMLLHRWRAEEMAVLVGAGTVAADKPELTVRYWEGETHCRIFLDGNLKNKYASGSGNTLVYNRLHDLVADEVEYIKIPEENMLPGALHSMYTKQINSVLVEGGYQTLQHFLEAGLWDEIRIIKSKELVIGHGLKAPHADGVQYDEIEAGSDIITWYKK